MAIAARDGFFYKGGFEIELTNYNDQAPGILGIQGMPNLAAL
jgi:hypothetical protein